MRMGPAHGFAPMSILPKRVESWSQLMPSLQQHPFELAASSLAGRNGRCSRRDIVQGSPDAQVRPPRSRLLEQLQ
jgi:hypothetical protein